MVTPVPLWVIELPRVPVWEPLFHPVKELSSNPASGIGVSPVALTKPKDPKTAENPIEKTAIIVLRRRTFMFKI